MEMQLAMWFPNHVLQQQQFVSWLSLKNASSVCGFGRGIRTYGRCWYPSRLITPGGQATVGPASLVWFDPGTHNQLLQHNHCHEPVLPHDFTMITYG